MNQQILDAYKYHRQTRPLLSATRALKYARDDEKAGKRRYPESYIYRFRDNEPWQSGSTTLRWIEKPESIGLRNVGFADEIAGRAIDHRGWFTDEFQDETLRGIVYQWPARHGAERYVYGYADPNNEGAAALCLDVTDDKEGAARYADHIAEHAAEEEREYSAASNARLRFDDLGDQISTTRKSLLRLIAELKQKRRALCDAPAMMEAIKTKIVDGLDEIRETREKRAELENGFAYHAGWSQG